MTIKEASKKFNITEQEIADYEARGFIVSNGGEYTEKAFSHLGVLRTLLAAGMVDDTVIRYLKLLDKEGTQQEQTAILRIFRAKLLDRVHEWQQALDHIDYLIYQTKK